MTFSFFFILYAPVNYNPTDKQQVFDCSEDQVNELMRGIDNAYVECGLGIQHESADDFVCTTVKWSEINKQVIVNQLVPDASCGCNKYKQFCGFVPKADKVNVVAEFFVVTRIFLCTSNFSMRFGRSLFYFVFA